MGEEKKGFFRRLVSGLTKTRDNIVSGMDSIFHGFSRIDDDFYEYEEENLRVVGRRTGKIYMLGDEVRVRVIRTDIQARTIDFMFVEKEEGDFTDEN